MRHIGLLSLLGLAAVVVSTAGCTDEEEGTPVIARCEADLTPWTKTGSGALARSATTADLFTGDAANAREGDVLLANDRIRVIVETPSKRVGTKPQGGNIIDADIVRPEGEESRDQFGELPTFLNFGRTIEFETIEILSDGSKGGPAIVAATGRDVAYDFIHLQGLLGSILSGVSLPDVDENLELRATSYYVLNPGSDAVHVVQALCYEGTEGIAIPVGDLVNGGGEVEVFGGAGGFGSTGTGGVSSIAAALGKSDGHPFYGYLAEKVAYGYVPEAERAQVLTVSGVTGTIFNTRNLTQWLSEGGPTPEGAVVLEKGESALVVRDFVVTRDASGIYDYFYEKAGEKTGLIKGRVTRDDGSPAVGARVSALLPKRVASLFTTDADGRFEGRVPVGTIDLRVDDGVVRSESASLAIAVDATVEHNVKLPARATVNVKIRNAANEPMPGKITVVCDGACSHSRSDDQALRFRDTGADALPNLPSIGETFDIRYVGPDAQAAIELPAGDYTVWVSRGAEWSLEKHDVSLAEGATENIEAKLEHVVDTTGWMSGDLHVHAISSPDSVIGNVDRLVSFMAEGTDVLVSTDHELIIDFAPVLASIPNGDKFITTITGLELTTFDYGHYNSFPLVRDDSMRNGGAPDWGNGNDPGMTPGEIMETLHAFPGEQVVQLNHARGVLGVFSSIGLDTRTLWTRVNPAAHRIRPVEPDAVTGDTRLFDDNFTAIEIMNGHAVADFNVLAKDWFALLNRGLKRTGTAVSDTHTRHGNSGIPRTYVKVGEDDPKKLDVSKFVSGINNHQAIGTNGPFLVVEAKAGSATAGAGDSIASSDGKVTYKVEVRVPDWMDVSEALVFVNTKGTETDGRSDPDGDSLPDPHARAALTFDQVAVGTSFMKKAVASFDLELTEDSWIVVVVQGGNDMYPVVGTGGVVPRAFANPLFVDVGGNGWTPPVSIEAERARIGKIAKSEGSPLRSEVTEEELREILTMSCHAH